MQFQFTILVIPLLLAAVVSAGVSEYARRRRTQTDRADALAGLALSLTVWLLGYALEIAGSNLPTKLFWGQVQYIGITTAPVFWLILSIYHVAPGRVISWRMWLLLLTLPAITLVLVFTTQMHGLVWNQIGIIYTPLFSALDISHGPWFWVHSLYSYVLLLGGAVIMFHSLGRTKGLYRRQAAALVVAVLAPWIGNAIYLLRLSPIPHLDITPFAFTITLLAMAWSILGFQFIDLAPIAREVLIDQWQDGMIVLDRQNRISDINPAAQQVIGQPASRLIGQPAEKAFSRWPGLVDRYRDVSLTTTEIQIEQSGHSDWYELHISPLYDRRQQLIGRLITLRDINARKRAEEQLRQLSRAVEASPTSIVITDTEGRIEYVNPKFTRLTGYTLAEALGQNPRILKSDQTPVQVHQDLWQTITAGREWRGEFCNVKKNGDLYWESASISPILDEQNRITHYVAVKEDITERRQLEQMRDDLIHTMVHDLRNPLSGILIALQLLETKAGALLSGRMLDTLRIAQQSSERMLNLVNSILDISRLESGRMPLNQDAVALPVLIDQMLSFQKDLIAQKEIGVEIDLPADLPFFYGDRALIGRVIQNLLDNSAKFTPTQGLIRISAAQTDPGWITVSIGNSGPPIEPAIRERLFGKFVTGKQQGRGSGLGLAFCRLAVEAHGGQIGVSGEPGQETVFRFTLPAAPSENTP